MGDLSTHNPPPSDATTPTRPFSLLIAPEFVKNNHQNTLSIVTALSQMGGTKDPPGAS